MRMPLAAAFVLCAALVLPPPACGLINLNFTPADLAKKADLILVVELQPADAQGKVESTIRRCLKGEVPAQPPVINLGPGDDEPARTARALIARSPKQLGVFVAGKDEAGAAITYLHVAGRWLRLRPGDGAWTVQEIDQTQMPAVWEGGTDMLARILEQVLSQPQMQVPVAAGCFWSDDEQKLGTIAGLARALRAVDLVGDGRAAIYVAADGGDRLFRYDADANKFLDITGQLDLAAKSKAAAWGDFDSNGRLDLASWDGAALGVWYQDTAGRFALRTIDAAPAGECLGLSIVGLDARSPPRLLWSGPAGPRLLASDAGGAWRALDPLVPAGADVAALGPPGACLAADFDGDALCDVLWACEKGGLLFAGTPGGGFTAAACDVARGAGGGAMVGDFDADGLFDVLTVSAERCMLWQNRGQRRFEETFDQSGELPHVYAGGGRSGNVCDFNNDGRQDLFITFGSSRPLLFFNRGFRSFGHAHSLDMVEMRRLGASHRGQQAGLVADLDGDAADDIAMVLPNGELWVVFRDWRAQPLAVRAALPLGKGFAGPLRVTGWDGPRCLGAWNVVAGTGEGFFGKSNKGPLRLTWRLPGGREQSQNVVVLRPTRVVLPNGPGEGDP
jgi:hypothetical protein